MAANDRSISSLRDPMVFARSPTHAYICVCLLLVVALVEFRVDSSTGQVSATAVRTRVSRDPPTSRALTDDSARSSLGIRSTS